MLFAAEEIVPASGDTQLVTAVLLAIALVVVLISWAKTHPFISLILGSGALGVLAGLGVSETIASFTAGVGSTVGSVGLLIALGAMIGGLLADSGGADRIVDSVVHKVSTRRLPWAMAGVAALIGLPLFFEVGIVLLIPVVLLVARRTGINLLTIGIPALAGLSVLHGLVPPHPGPLVAIDALGADLGTTLAYGLLLAIPTVIIAGPLFASVISRYVVLGVPGDGDEDRVVDLDRDRSFAGVGGNAAGAGGSAAAAGGDTAGQDGGRAAAAGRAGAGGATAAGSAGGGGDATGDNVDAATGLERPWRRPGVTPTVLTVLLPVVLMLARAIGEIVLDEESRLHDILYTAGTPVIALLAGVLAAMFFLGARVGMDRNQVNTSIGGALPGVAGILLIVAAGGGFKQVLIDAGVGEMVGDFADDANLSAMVLAWLVAVGIRLATGSATVATITAAGIVAPLAADLGQSEVALMALVIGAGSLFFSHVNDAGFWLVKEYFGMTVGQTLKTWSVMETIISVTGLILVLLLDLVV